MPDPIARPCPLPLPLPHSESQRLVLRCLRRMAAHGVHDAQAALWVFECFGLGFRRPLVLLRGFVLEIAQFSQRRIQVAHCCALRMTHDEARLIGVLATAAESPACAHRHLRELTGGDDAASPFSLALAFNAALEELGRPLVL